MPPLKRNVQAHVPRVDRPHGVETEIDSPNSPNTEPGTRLVFLPEDAPPGLRQLRDLIHESGLFLSQTANGQFFLWGEPPLSVKTLDFTVALVNEVQDQLREVGKNVLVMPLPSPMHCWNDSKRLTLVDVFIARSTGAVCPYPNQGPPMASQAIQSLYMADNGGHVE